MYTAEQSAVAEAMIAIKTAWHCDEHDTCFIDGKQDHIEINRFRLKAWASSVVGISFVLLISSLMIVLQQAHQCIASNPPPTELLSLWLGVTTNLPATKACGRLGPNIAMVATQPSSTVDNTGLLLQMLNSAFNMFASAQTPAASTSLVVPVVATPHQFSSPPPALKTELKICIQEFAAAPNLPADVINTALAHLSKHDYSPDAIYEASL